MMAKTLFTIILLLACSTNAMAYDFMVGGLCYDICTGGDSVIVTYESTSYKSNYNGLEGDIAIPQKVKHNGKSYDVVRIGLRAFEDCKGLTSVTIPNSVTEIGMDAFYRCSGLMSVTIPNSVTTIGQGAFMGCTGLTTVTIPSSVTSISFFVFSDCTNLVSINVDPLNTTYDSRKNCNAIIETATNSLIVGCKNTQMPASLRTIAPTAFYGCSELLTLTIPDSVTVIGSRAFDGCTGLTSVTIPNSVTTIGSSAFYGCTGLVSVNIPPSVTEIDFMAFYGCTGLASVNIPPSITEIGSSVFSGCTGLTSVNIPPSVTEIGSNAFYGCSGLASVNIPPSVTKIDDYTFYGCSRLASVNIPTGVTTIGSRAFDGCTGLTSVTIPNSVTTIGMYAFDDCTGLTSVTIPNSVTTIGQGAFLRCTGLTSVTIPSSVIMIDSGAFENCTSLETIFCGISSPQNVKTDVSAFKSVNKQTCNLLIPRGCLDSYSSVAPWLYFSYKIENDSIATSDVQEQSSSIQETWSLKQQFEHYYEDEVYDKAIETGERLMALPDSIKADKVLIMELAFCYFMTNNYRKAKEYYEMLDTASVDIDGYINKMLGDCCMGINDYANAEIHYSKAYYHYLNDNSLFSGQGEAINMLLRIYDCYIAQRKYLEAVNAYQEYQERLSIIKEDRNHLLPNPISFDLTSHFVERHSLARIIQYGEELCSQGNHDEAIQVYSDAILLYQKIKGENSLEVAVMTERMGRCYLQMSLYNQAIEALNQSKEISGIDLDRYLSLKKLKSILSVNLLFPSSHTRVYSGLEHDLILDYGIYYASQGEFGSSYHYLRPSLDRIYDNCIDFLSNSASADRAAYWEKHSHLFCEIYPSVVSLAANEHLDWLTFGLKYQDLYGDLYNKSALFAKGLLLTSDNEFSRIIYESGDSILISRYKELEALKNISEPLTDEQLQIVTDKATKIEKELLVLSKDYNEFMANLQLTWQDVQARLGDNDIAVEFLSFPKLGTDSIYYIALTLRKKYDMPHLVFLGEQRELEVAVERAYSSKELSQIIWGQIAEHREYEHVLDSNLGISKKGELEGVKNIYFSPSGELHTVAIESIPHWEKTDSLMSECYNIYRLSSTRELVINRKDFNASGAAVYGGIEYNASVASMGSTPRKAANSSTDYARHHGFDIDSSSDYAQRGFDADSAGYRGKIWADLKYAQLEADSITSILNDKKIDVVKRSRDVATETSFKNLSGERKRIIHIATHGFCWSEAAAQHKSRNKQLSFLSGQNPEDKAMTRTGLLFSGANHCFADGNDSTDVIPEGVDDGVLTAREVSTLDLRGLDLLVLSACQTGQGEINSEGVFGLQRGFKKAGVQSIIMSLWTVNDRATSDMMMLFYRYYTGGMSKHDAFLMAQKDIRNKYGNYKDEKHIIPTDKPHWAAFILLDAIDN